MTKTNSCIWDNNEKIMFKKNKKFRNNIIWNNLPSKDYNNVKISGLPFTRGAIDKSVGKSY